MTSPDQQIAAVNAWLAGVDRAEVAVSGGVDSLTLGILTARVLGEQAGIWHAVSPAVPPAATARVHRIGAQEGWRLQLVEAGELEDEAYLANPYRRCFHCKHNLYTTLAERGPGTLLSGTNADDLKDFRPGLEAARDHGVRHPFVECGIDKAAIRAIAHRLGFHDIAELPASPCLSSRIETGVRIQAPVLVFVDRVEGLLRDALSPGVVRCRIHHDAIAVQLDPASLEALADPDRWRERIRALAAPLSLPDTIRFEPYRMGSAFVDVA